MKINRIIFVLLSIIFLYSCSDDSTTEPTSLVADAGASQQVNILDLVTLDGTGSTGLDGFTYEWTYVGDVPEEEINFEGKNTARPRDKFRREKHSPSNIYTSGW